MEVAPWLRDDVHGETDGLARALYIRIVKELVNLGSHSLITPTISATGKSTQT
jgi:hypothetical protein